MKCPSLYNFYRVYFGIPSSGKLQFALAIRDTEHMLAEIFEQKMSDGVSRYGSRPYARQLSKTFLDNFYRLAEHHYDDMFTMMERRANQVWLPKEQLGTRLNLYIPFARLCRR